MNTIIINGIPFTIESVLRDLATEYAAGFIETDEYLTLMENIIRSTFKIPLP